MPIDYADLVRTRDPLLRTAALVRLRPAYATRIRDVPPGTLLVAIADKFEKVNCALVGGDAGGRYWRIPSPWLEVVDPASVLKDTR